MTMADHDIQHGLMVDYVSGSLPQPLALLVASHVSLNNDAKKSYQILSEVGGNLLEDTDGVSMNSSLGDFLDTLDSIPQDAPKSVKNTITAAPSLASEPILPAPLQNHIQLDMEEISWKARGAGVKEFTLPISEKGLKASLLKVEPGSKIPDHTHEGHEYTLILDGVFIDGTHHYERGEFVCNDQNDTHSPEACPDNGCICFVVQDAPLKFKGLLGFLINPFLKM
ncbi:ChrR family anti-sigma-E factor [Temperatibacter marinus]|uniref:ChrR family anti-sigma-E factor n=1 Tax=Temperatibacter marinus TaxID=1456591 RepID=A0AA52EJI6_9PROT|nr:ChrR family anti-sigma-E factor [Temperatibacter marinus]WND03687.1 ChrR family anti-sigma-E factor [Temperatibacter marinus]